MQNLSENNTMTKNELNLLVEIIRNYIKKHYSTVDDECSFSNALLYKILSSDKIMSILFPNLETMPTIKRITGYFKEDEEGEPIWHEWIEIDDEDIDPTEEQIFGELYETSRDSNFPIYDYATNRKVKEAIERIISICKK